MRSTALLLALLALPPGDKHGLDLPVHVDTQAEEEDSPSVITPYGFSLETENTCWVIDTSGSMQKKGEWAIAKQEVRRSMRELPDGSHFGIVAFANGVKRFPEEGTVKLSQATRMVASRWLERKMSADKSCLRYGLLEALKKLSGLKGRNVILYVGDGGVNCAGELEPFSSHVIQERKRILREVTAKNKEVRAGVFAIGVLSPKPHDRRFMEKLASANGGTYRQVSR